MPRCARIIWCRPETNVPTVASVWTSKRAPVSIASSWRRPLTKVFWLSLGRFSQIRLAHETTTNCGVKAWNPGTMRWPCLTVVWNEISLMRRSSKCPILPELCGIMIIYVRILVYWTVRMIRVTPCGITWDLILRNSPKVSAKRPIVLMKRRWWQKMNSLTTTNGRVIGQIATMVKPIFKNTRSDSTTATEWMCLFAWRTVRLRWSAFLLSIISIMPSTDIGNNWNVIPCNGYLLMEK